MSERITMDLLIAQARHDLSQGGDVYWDDPKWSRLELQRAALVAGYGQVCNEFIRMSNHAHDLEKKLEAVEALRDKWHNATDLVSGSPHIVSQAFAAGITAALDGAKNA